MARNLQPAAGSFLVVPTMRMESDPAKGGNRDWGSGGITNGQLTNQEEPP